MIKKRRELLRALLVLFISVPMVSNAATVYTSTGNGNWSTIFTSSGSGTPVSYIIQAGDTVTVNVNGTSGIDTIQIYGELNFDNGRKVDMTSTGVVLLESGGTIVAGNAGSKFRFSGGTDIPGPFSLNGPLQATGATNGIFVSPPVPVDWLGFDVTNTSGEIKVTWQTASEQNNNYFVVQYSGNGLDWIDGPTIYSQAKGGNSNEVLNYAESLNRNGLPFEDGKCFIRVKQVDFDFTTDYSSVKVIKENNDQRIKVVQLNNNQFTTNLSSNSQEIALKVYAVDGTLILDEELISAKHYNIINPGMYLMLFEENGVVTTHKILVH